MNHKAWATQYEHTTWAKERRLEYFASRFDIKSIERIVYENANKEDKKAMLREQIATIDEWTKTGTETYEILRKEGWNVNDAQLWANGVSDIPGLEKEKNKLNMRMRFIEYPTTPEKELNIDLALTRNISEFAEVNKWGFTKCLTQEEKTPSMKIYLNGKFKCFSCGKHGDVIDYLQEKNGWDFRQTVQYLTGG